MKTYVLKLALLFFRLSLIFSCEPGIVIPSNTPSDFAYTLHVDSTFNTNAPALQSFAHGTSGSEWLLFAGRTNEKDDDGGLHDMSEKSNYANTSFPPTSYNENIYVYDPIIDAVPTSINISEMLEIVSRKFKSYNSDTIKKYKTVFKNTNPLVRQVDEYLYVIGGYGAIDFKKPKNGYITYDHVAKIHVPSMIQLVKGNYAGVKESKLFAFAQNKNLVSTGGELIKVGVNFYAVTGHCFGSNCSPPGQKYLDAAYPFTIKKDTLHTLTLSVGTPITDVIDPKAVIADDLSNFRRRDQPITPAIYKSPANGKIQEGIAIYSGVFKAGDDDNLQAWNDAIYIHPNWANKEGRLFTNDKEYNQENYNVYACPSFVLYDSESDLSHTYLLGGIGNGIVGVKGTLSGFTNTAVRIETNIGEYPISSKYELIQPGNLFNKNNENKAPFYGAEAILFPNHELPLVEALYYEGPGINQLKQKETEIIDLNKINDDEIVIGYVYGGIEAFESNPATYGPGKSRASNVIFKVTLKKK